MAHITSRSGADCCVVALANYYGKPYDEVLSVLLSCRAFPDKENEHSHGFSTATYTKAMHVISGTPALHLGCPRRGQDKITGIIRFARPNARSGHLAACIDGHVFDSSAQGVPINQYRAIWGYNLKGIWV